MQFELKTFENGTVSVWDHHFGETMHSLIGPDQEAQIVYLQQSQIKERLSKSQPEPLVVYDIGLGIGTNALACLDLFIQMQPKRDLQLFSFESNPLGLKFALQHPTQFPYLQKYTSWLSDLLNENQIHFKTPSGQEFFWQLFVGDFRDLVTKTTAPEVVFYDLYSPKSCPELWNLQTFELVFKSTEARRSIGQDTFLCTYCASTAVRTAMLLAGFHVGHGISTEGKRETTVASTLKTDLIRPLGKAWLDRWNRSSNALPCDISENKKTLVREIFQERLHNIN